MADCLFCGIAAHRVPATIVHEDDDVVVFKDLRPQAPLHVLVIPKEHVASLAEADVALAGTVAAAAAKAAADAGYSASGYRVVANTGPDAGQSVAHLHFHVLAGRPLGWPPG
ncbi:MAG: HIT domain-containing protein [Chloroflexota bacterium]|nr:HIT domain-containing protein [Chloroflexota bacterium]MDE3192874.1 HIT domain-containing protein [Chloroflexota bacterium]